MERDKDNKSNLLESFKISIEKKIPTNFSIYIISRCKVPRFIYYFICIILHIQLFLFTIVPLTKSGEKENVIPFITEFSKYLLTNVTNYNTDDFARYMFYFYIFYFIINGYCQSTYKRQGFLNAGFCYLMIVFDVLLHTILQPMIFLLCLMIVNHSLLTKSLGSDVVLYATFVLFSNIFASFRFIFARNFLVLSIHPMENIIYYPYFLYFTIMFLVISIGYIFSNSYYYIFPAFISILYGILFFSKPFITNEILSSSSYVSALTLATTILSFSFISNILSQTSIITLNVGIAIPITFYYRWTISRLKKKSREFIRDPNFVELCKTPKNAALYYAYAAMQGCSNVYDCSHVESLQMKFGEDTYVSYFLCMSEMSLPKFPKNVVTKPSGFLKTDAIFCELHQRLTNPCHKEDIVSLHHVCAMEIYNNLKKCSDSLTTITDLVFNESFNILSFNTFITYDVFEETFRHIMNFMQMFPNSPYVENISQIFLTICPSNTYKQEIDFWKSVNYQSYFKQTKGTPMDNKTKYDYTNSIKKSPNRSQKFKEIADDFSDRKIDQYITNKGPFSYSRRGILMWIAFLGILGTHLTFSYMINFDLRTKQNTYDAQVNNYYILQNLANISSFVPLYRFLQNDEQRDENLFSNDTFIYFRDQVNESLLFLDYIRRSSFSRFTRTYYVTIYKFMYQMMAWPKSVFQQFYQNALYLYESVFTTINSNSSSHEISHEMYCNYISGLNSFNMKFSDILGQAADVNLIMMKYSFTTIALIYISCYFVSFSIVISLFHVGRKRENSFYFELKKVSKSFLINLKNFYKKVSESSVEIENQFVLEKKNDETIGKLVYMPFLTLLYLPTTILFAFSVIVIVFLYSSTNCYIQTQNSRIESYGYLVEFELKLSKLCINSILDIYETRCIPVSETLNLINETMYMMSNISETKYGQSKALCKLCYSKYYQIFSDSTTLIEQESSIYLKLLENILNSTEYTEETLSNETRKLIFQTFYSKLTKLINETAQEVLTSSNGNIFNMPIVYYSLHFIFLNSIIFYIVYIFNLQKHFDIPYFVLSLTLSNAKMLNGNYVINDIIESSFESTSKNEEKKIESFTKEFCDKMMTPVMIIDCELKLLYYNDEAQRIFFISKEFKDNLSLFEILKDGFIEEGTNKKIGQLINEFAYREFHTIRTYKILGSINSVSDHILSNKEKDMKINYELSIFPIYTTQKHFSQLILIFTPEAELSNYSNFLAKYRKLPITIRNEWIMKDFNLNDLKRSNIINETKSGIIAIVRVKTDFGEKSPQIIDQVFRRFDVIISQSKVFKYYRTHASMYCFGTDFSHEMEFTPYIVHKIILVLRQMFDEAGKVSLSKNVEVNPCSAVGFGNVIIGIPGKEHPFLDVWGSAITDALDMIKVAQLNKIMIRKRVLEQNNLTGIMPELVIPMN